MGVVAAAAAVVVAAAAAAGQVTTEVPLKFRVSAFNQYFTIQTGRTLLTRCNRLNKAPAPCYTAV